MHISNGTDISADWDGHIAVSLDGTLWTTINKVGLNVEPVISGPQQRTRQSDPSVKVGRIRLTHEQDNTFSYEFDIDTVQNQPTWIDPATSLLDRVNLAVDELTTWINDIPSISTTGLATSANQTTMISQLSTLITEAQNDLDFEIKCARDTVTGIIYMWKMEKDESTGVITYEYRDISGAVFVPVNPMEFCDSTAILNLINGNLVDIENLLTGSARTFNLIITTGAGSIPAGAIVGSVINIGAAAGTVAGTSVAPGISVPIPHLGKNETYGAIAYDGSGTSLLIQYTN